jgi:hypothetical protein
MLWCRYSGLNIPASSMARQQPHTVAIELLPQDSVIRLSALRVCVVSDYIVSNECRISVWIRHLYKEWGKQWD